MKSAHTVPLVPEVMALLDGLPKLGEFVFSNDGERPIRGFDHIRRRLPGDGWTLHDLRRTMRTGLSACGVATEISERVIGHAPGGLVRVYDKHDFLQAKYEALHLWSERLQRLVA
jgi:integrase